jgi:pSer/pThr/pTyr-binding forkhead associated (FHA) protein
MAQLVIKSQDSLTRVALNGIVTIGRHSSNTVPLLESKASRRHARVVPSAKGFIIEDLASANGTFVNGARVTRRMLKSGDEIRIGDAVISFSDQPTDDLVGSTMGNYRILSKIGQGGMGAVYKATQISMDRIVALKLLSPNLTRDREYVKGFVNEARLAGSLNHPNIINVHDFGEESGTYYFSMEFIEGENVQDILQREHKLDLPRAIDFTIQVACALEYAHSKSVIHQDVKPQNIMIDTRGDVRLADLGLAKNLGKGAGNPREGVIMGTPHYLAPEIARREVVDGRADQYSLGATLFHMMTGRVPYDGPNSLAVITRHINDPPPNPKKFDVTIPDSIVTIVQKMMAKKPDDRFQTDAELVRELRKVRQEVGRATSVSDRLPAQPAPAAHPRRRLRTRTGVIARRSSAGLYFFLAIVFLAAAAVVIALRMYGPQLKEALGRMSRTGGAEKTSQQTPPEQAPQPEKQPLPRVVPPTPKVIPDRPEVKQPPVQPGGALAVTGWELSDGFRRIGDTFVALSGGDAVATARFRDRQFSAKKGSLILEITARGSPGRFAVSIERDATHKVFLIVSDQEFHLGADLDVSTHIGASVDTWKFEPDKRHRIELRFADDEVWFYADGGIQRRIGDPTKGMAAISGRLVITSQNLDVTVHRVSWKE